MFIEKINILKRLTDGLRNTEKAIDINKLDTGVRFLPVKKSKMPPDIEYQYVKNNRPSDVPEITEWLDKTKNSAINLNNLPANRFALEKLAKSRGMSTNELLLSEFSGKPVSNDITKVASNNIIEFDINKSRENFMKMLEKSETTKAHKVNMKYYAENANYILNSETHSPYSYNGRGNAVIYNPSHKNFKNHDENFALAHEISHHVDNNFYQSYANQDFIEAVVKTRQKVYNNYKKIRKLFTKNTGKYYEDAGISGIMSALTHSKMKVPYHHKREYWNKEGTDIVEIFANMSAIDILGSKSKAEFFNNGILSDLYNAYRKII